MIGVSSNPSASAREWTAQKIVDKSVPSSSIFTKIPYSQFLNFPTFLQIYHCFWFRNSSSPFYMQKPFENHKKNTSDPVLAGCCCGTNSSKFRTSWTSSWTHAIWSKPMWNRPWPTWTGLARRPWGGTATGFRCIRWVLGCFLPRSCWWLMIFANILGHTEMLGTKWGNNHVVVHVYEGNPFSTFTESTGFPVFRQGPINIQIENGLQTWWLMMGKIWKDVWVQSWDDYNCNAQVGGRPPFFWWYVFFIPKNGGILGPSKTLDHSGLREG